jgi:ATP-dependent protease HslVU (ClpYQ) peptidase subunit
MTTIAYKDGIMAADGRETLDGFILNDACKKIMRLGDGSLVGGHGETQGINQVMDALFAGKDKLPKAEGADLLMVKPDGKMYLKEGGDRKFRPLESNLKFYAIGSGARYAITAMKAGADAKRAVELAIEADVWSGGKIQVVPLKPPINQEKESA